MGKVKKYNHAFDIAFEVISEDPTGENVTTEELFSGLQKRMHDLKKSGDEIIEACGLPFDTYEM
jgi:hypothetical protein